MPLQAQQEVQCASREDMLQMLTGDFDEVRQAIGFSSSNFVMEMYSNEETGSWTMTYTLPDGNMCIIGHGLNYEELNETLEPNL